MDIPILAYTASFIAMALIVVGYFVKNKTGYLLFQFLGIIFLIFSYFFSVAFVAMIGLIIGLFRTLTYFLYERKNKLAPLFWPFLFSALSILGYFAANYIENSSGRLLDIMCVLALCMYAFTFRIKDFRVLKFATLVPTTLSILYNILIFAPVFNTLSYSFELGANILSIILYYKAFNREKIIPFKKEKTNEQN